MREDPLRTSEALVRAGKFALGRGKDTGTHLAVAALEAALHLSG